MNEELELEPSKTYKILNGRVAGWIDTLEAIKQSINKTLDTERLIYEIYSDQYGVEIENLIGEDFQLVELELERVIKEALEPDERILEIKDFVIQQTDKESLYVYFTIDTLFGSFILEKEV